MAKEPTRKIVPLDQVPAVVAAKGEVDRVSGIIAKLRDELELADFQAAEEVNASEVENAIFNGKSIPAVAIAAAPPSRARRIIVGEMTAAESALERKEGLLERAINDAIAGELRKPEHRAALAAMGKIAADAFVILHGVRIDAMKFAAQLKAAGYPLDGEIASQVYQLDHVDFNLSATQSLGRATMLTMIERGVVDAVHPAAVMVKQRD
jgi:hypothetical protein